MPAEIHCTHCASANVIFSKKRGAYVCEDCGHVLPERPVEPMRIFLSYGHDANEDLVRRIKADLEKRGHDVWFDKNDIKAGDDWRRFGERTRLGCCGGRLARHSAASGCPVCRNPCHRIRADRRGRRSEHARARVLPPRLPDWLGLVVTSRPESAVQTPLQGLNPFVIDTRTEANRADLRDYLRHQLAPQLQHRSDLSRQSDAAADADRLIGQILEKCEGVFLYAERFCDDVQHGHLSLDRPDQFPQGLGGIFCQWFQHQFPDLEKFRKDIRPALRAILAAREPLPVEIPAGRPRRRREAHRRFRLPPPRRRNRRCLCHS